MIPIAQLMTPWLSWSCPTKKLHPGYTANQQGADTNSGYIGMIFARLGNRNFYSQHRTPSQPEYNSRLWRSGTSRLKKIFLSWQAMQHQTRNELLHSNLQWIGSN